MSTKFRKLNLTARVMTSVAALMATGNIVHADISGFGDFSQFTINQRDAKAAPTFPVPGTIQLVNGTDESRSIFFNTPQDIAQFTMSFTYQVPADNVDAGITFVLQNDPRGPTAIGPLTGNHGDLGIQNSVDLLFHLQLNAMVFLTNGETSDGVPTTNVSPISFIGGDPINVQFSYSGTTLTEKLFDPVTLDRFTTDYSISIPTVVGGSTAYVGITAGAGDANDQGGGVVGGSRATQRISDFQFSSNAVNWTNAIGGKWGTASNWAPDVVPTSSLDANFSTGSTVPYNITLTGASSANNLNVQGDNVALNLGANNVALSGKLNVTGFGTLAVSGSGTVSVPEGVSVGQASDTGPGSGSLYNHLGIFQNASIIGNITNNPSGQVYGTGTIVGNFVNTGLVAPGTNLPGTLALGGKYTQMDSGTLSVRINGPSTLQATPQPFDTLVVTDAATLGGNLVVTTPGTSSTPGFLPYNNSYTVVSAGSISGNFSNAPTVMQTMFTDGRTSGVFDVTYGQNTVALSNFHQIHVVSFGVSYADGTLEGGVDALRVHDSVAKVAGVVDNVLYPEPSSADNSTNLLNAIKSMSNHVHAGDTCIFFISSHGNFDSSPGGPEVPTPRMDEEEVGGTIKTTTTIASRPSELDLSDSGPPLDAPTLTAAFQSDPIWKGVNKLFIVDSCYAGGLWAGPDGSPQYLSQLDHSAMIAAASEGDLADSVPNGPLAGQGYLSLAVEDILSNLGTDELLDFSDLLSQINAEVTEDQIAFGNSGFIRNPALGYGIAMPTSNDVWGEATSDFELGLAGTPVPEPSTLGFLCVAVVGIAQTRRVRIRSSDLSGC